MSTAVCNILGKEDDCNELQSLRKLRDDYVLCTPEGQMLFQEYKLISVNIIDMLYNSSYPKEFAMQIYHKLLPIINLVDSLSYEKATIEYKRLINTLSKA